MLYWQAITHGRVKINLVRMYRLMLLFNHPVLFYRAYQLVVQYIELGIQQLVLIH